VHMILQILRQVNCHVLFCEDEECGGRGASAFTKSGILPDVNYIVELDRKGENDAVYYGCDNRAFREYVAEFGFREAFGSFSDISILAPHLKTAAVNLSTGYYNAHRNHELIDTQVMATNTERVIEMVMTPTEHYPYRTKSAKQPKFTLGKSLFDHELTDLTGNTETQKLLMPLPEDTRLMADGIEVPSKKNYMIDRGGNIYAYIEALDAAVESEMLIACTADGAEISFRADCREMKTILSYEDALKRSQ